jgi:hypothetical protein
MSAEVVGIEDQLTVPSRTCAPFVDVWISIRRSSAGVAWERLFTSLVDARYAGPPGVASFEVVPFTERRGWIVARGVNESATSRRAMEEQVRALVCEVNGMFSSPPTLADKRDAGAGPTAFWRAARARMSA